MTESPGKKSRRLERLARDAVDAAKDDRSADAVNLVEAGVAEDAQAFALHLLGIAARAERPTPARSSLWRLWGWVLLYVVFAVAAAVALTLSWVQPGAWLACAPEVGSRLVQLALLVGWVWWGVQAVRLLMSARVVLARGEAGGSEVHAAVVGDGSRWETVVELLDGAGERLVLRFGPSKVPRYRPGQEVVVHGTPRRGEVVAVVASGRVMWGRITAVRPPLGFPRRVSTLVGTPRSNDVSRGPHESSD